MIGFSKLGNQKKLKKGIFLYPKPNFYNALLIFSYLLYNNFFLKSTKKLIFLFKTLYIKLKTIYK